MNFQDIRKSLQLTPVKTVLDSPWSKGYTRVAGTVSNLGEFISVPANLINDNRGYSRRLMFQFNVSFTSNFYVVNYKSLANFSSMLLLGGCICIKYRVGEVSFRYKLMDSHTDNWIDFDSYAGQVIKKNFCLEFWQDDSVFARGITQTFFIETGTIIVPDSIDSFDTIDNIVSNPLGLDDLSVNLPIIYPIDFSNIAFLDNV